MVIYSDGMTPFDRIERMRELAIRMCDCLARHADVGVATEFSGCTEDSIRRMSNTDMAVAVYVNLKEQIDGLADPRVSDLNAMSVSAHAENERFKEAVDASYEISAAANSSKALGKGSVPIERILDAFGVESDDGATVSVEDAERIAAVLGGRAM